MSIIRKGPLITYTATLRKFISDVSVKDSGAHDMIMIPIRISAWCRAAGSVMSASVHLASSDDKFLQASKIPMSRLAS